jgi:hypothetical protein
MHCSTQHLHSRLCRTQNPIDVSCRLALWLDYTGPKKRRPPPETEKKYGTRRGGNLVDILEFWTAIHGDRTRGAVTAGVWYCTESPQS